MYQDMTDKEVENSLVRGQKTARDYINDCGLAYAISIARHIRVSEVGHAFAVGFMETLQDAIVARKEQVLKAIEEGV